MLRSEQFFNEKKDKKERLKEIAEGIQKKPTDEQLLKDENESAEEEQSEEEGNPTEIDNIVKQLVDGIELEGQKVLTQGINKASIDIQKTGNTEGLTEEELKKQKRKEKKKQKAKEKKKNKWYNSKIQSSIYVQGLPTDATWDEIVTFFGRAGVLRLDDTGKEKIKLYKLEDEVTLKGDATVFYAKPESVEVALDNLNGAEIKPGYRITIEKAQFEQKGDYVQREKKELDEIAKIRIKVNQEKMLSWGEEEEGEGLKIVVIKNMFTPDEVINDETFAYELELGVKEECENQQWQVKRITVYEFHPEGVVMIKFTNAADAEKCIKVMNGRLFGGRTLECDYWDGKTNYRVVNDSTAEQQQRMDDFGKWLEQSMDQIVKNELVEAPKKSEITEENQPTDIGDGDKTPELTQQD